jgi:hypothetical protein
VEGTTDAESEQVGSSNTWELLLATYTVTVGGVTNSVGGLTSIDMLIPRSLQDGINSFGSNGDNTLDYVSGVDGLGESPNDSFNFTVSGDVNFETNGTPEPGSLGLLTIGGLALLSRRRNGKPGEISL